MKKCICLIIIALLLTGCKNTPLSENTNAARTDFSRGVWLSFSEINNFLSSPRGFEEEFNEAVSSLKALDITDLYFHIRSHCDSVVKSEYFPQTEASQSAELDILELVINACHREGIKVHAWINPYRVNAASSDVTALPENSPVIRWLNDETSENDKNVVLMNGIFLNPAEKEVRRLIVDGVKEIIGNYEVDGIHFDDYFYPTTDPEFDKTSFENYKSSANNPLNLDDWRRANVDALISDCKTALDLSGKNIVFSISPSADTEKNYSAHYADIKGWCEKGLIDRVIPQLYFGFEHTDRNFRFENLLKEWVGLCKNTKTELEIGLASYKIGTQSTLDGDEWMENDDIIARQVELCLKEKRVSGVCYFSYSYLTD